MNSPDLLPLIKALKQKYLIVEGLILNVENAKIVETLVSDINYDFDSLMVDCVALSYKELIPGADAIKQNVVVAKQEFDNRVTAWLSRVNEGCSYKLACDVPDIDRRSAPSGRAPSDACSNTSSVASLKKKKVRLSSNWPRLLRSLMRKGFNSLKQTDKRLNALSER